MTIDELIEALQAARDGKEIQCQRADGTWTAFPVQKWASYQHLRVKPEPREKWFGQYPDGQLTACAYRTSAEVEAFGPEYKPIRFIEEVQ